MFYSVSSKVNPKAFADSLISRDFMVYAWDK